MKGACLHYNYRRLAGMFASSTLLDIWPTVYFNNFNHYWELQQVTVFAINSCIISTRFILKLYTDYNMTETQMYLTLQVWFCSDAL